MAEEKKTRTIELLYKGRVMLQKGKLGWRFATLDKPDEDMFWTFKKSPQLYGVGVYKVEQPLDQPEDGNMTIHGGTFRWSRRWDDEESAALWDAQSDAAKGLVEAKRIAKNRGNEIDRLCAPLASIYRALSPFQREAFILYVMNEVRRNRMWKEGGE